MGKEAYIIAKGGAILGITNYVFLLIRMSISLIVMSSLGPELYGIRGVLLGFQSLLFSQISAFITIPFTRELSKTRKLGTTLEYSIVISTVFVFLFLMSLVIFFLYEVFGFIYFAQKISYSRLPFLLLISGIMIPLLTLQIFFSEILRSELRYIRYLLVINSRIFIFAICVILMIILKWLTLENVFISDFISVTASVFLGFLLVSKVLNKREIRFIIDLRYLKEFLFNAIQVEIGTIIGRTAFNLDSLLMPSIISLRYIGYYYFAKSLIRFFIRGINDVKTLYLPVLAYKATTKSDLLVKDYISVSLAMTLFLTNLFILPIIAFLDEILTLLSIIIPPFSEYLDAYLIVAIVILYSIIFAFYTDIVVYSDSKAKYYRRIFANSIGLVTYLLLAFILVLIASSFDDYYRTVLLALIFVLEFLARGIYWAKVAIEEEIVFPWLRTIIVETILVILSFFILLNFNYAEINIIGSFFIFLFALLYAGAISLIQLATKIITYKQLLLISKSLRHSVILKLILPLLKISKKISD